MENSIDPGALAFTLAYGFVVLGVAAIVLVDLIKDKIKNRSKQSENRKT